MQSAGLDMSFVGKSKNHSVPVRMTEEAKRMVEELAVDNGLAKSNVIEMAIRRLHRELDLTRPSGD